MSSAQAASRAKARRGASQPEPGRVTLAEPTEIKKEMTLHQIALKHDYKLFLFENKLKELNEIAKNNKTKENDTNLSTINESMLSEALQSMDNRMDHFESLMNSIDTSKNNTEVNLKVSKLENEQKELKSLLLKIQGTVMETQMQMMQIKNSGKNTTNLLSNEESVHKENVEVEKVNEEQLKNNNFNAFNEKKKGKK